MNKITNLSKKCEEIIQERLDSNISSEDNDISIITASLQYIEMNKKLRHKLNSVNSKATYWWKGNDELEYEMGLMM